MDRRATRRVKSLAGLAIVALVVAGSAAWFAIGRSRDAEESRGVVDAIQLASTIAVDESLTTANRLRVAAGLRAQTAAPETNSLLLDTLIRSPAGVSGVTTGHRRHIGIGPCCVFRRRDTGCGPRCGVVRA